MDKEKQKKYLSIAVLVLAVILISITYFFLLYRNQSIGEGVNNVIAVLRPLIIGAILAYIMKSTANFYEKHLMRGLMKSGKRSEKKARKIACGVAVIFTYLTWGAAITALMVIAIPQIIQSMTDFVAMLIENIPIYAQKVLDWLEKLVEEQNIFAVQFDDIVYEAEKWISENLTADKLTGIAAEYAKSLVGLISGLISSIIDIAIGLVISVFILLGRRTLAKKSMMLLHCLFRKQKTVDAITNEFKYADRMFGGFLEGKVLDSTLIGLIYYIVLELLNVPYPALVAVICGVTNIIPIFGPFIGAIPSGVIILAADPSKLIPFIIFVFVVQFVDGYIIDPHIVGGNIKMSSFCVVFAVILFGGLWGFFGLLIGVPTFAVIYDIFRKLSFFVLRKQGKQDVIDQFKLEMAEEKKPPKEKDKKKTMPPDPSASPSDPTTQDQPKEAVEETVSVGTDSPEA